jgi:GH24 family phage-related lysozyme (muramidase)
VLRGLLTTDILPTQPRQPHKLALFLYPSEGIMRHITQAGIDLIKQFEGFSPTVYICPAGYATIGYGHVVKPHERERFTSGITPEQAESLLRQDVQISERAVLRLITVPLTDGQFDALASFTFNLGAGALQRSTLRRKVNCGDHAAVPVEFRKWVWAGGRKLEGLVRRRVEEVNLYRMGSRKSFRVVLCPKDLFLNHGADDVADHDVALLNFGGFA